MQKPNKVPTVSPTAHVATNATVIGNVTIGDECCVLFNATIRGDCDSFVRLGERTNVQEGVCLHVSHDSPTIIGHDVTIGHAAVVPRLHRRRPLAHRHGGHGARRCRDRQSLPHRGRSARDGIGTHPGWHARRRSAARAKRPLTDEEKASLEESAAGYVEVGYRLASEGWLLTGEVPKPPLG